jgi:hypothetical protein
MEGDLSIEALDRRNWWRAFRTASFQLHESRHGLDAKAERLVGQYLNQVAAKAEHLNWAVKPALVTAGRRMLNTDRRLQTRIMFKAILRLLSLGRTPRPECDGSLARLVSRIARRRLPLTTKEAETLISTLADNASCLTYRIPVMGILRVISRHVDRHGLSPGLRKRLLRLQRVWQDDWYFNNLRKIQLRIARIAQKTDSRS